MMKKEELQKMDAQALREKINSFKKELFDLRLSAASVPIKDNSQFKKLRKNIARAFTYLHGKKEG
jgi:ribosomal protein L29